MIEELDLLKKDWKKNENSFNQVSENEIYKMIHKKSSSIVKWILVISILEFVVLNGASFLLNDAKVEKFMALHPYLNYFDKINYIIIIGFIYLFYRNYKSISVLSSAKLLITHILKTRKTVNYYIIWNIFIGCFFGVFGVIDRFSGVYNNNSTVEIKQSILLIFTVTFFTMIIIIAVIWGFYKLLYGNLLSKLSKNYEELKNIEL